MFPVGRVNGMDLQRYEGAFLDRVLYLRDLRTTYRVFHFRVFVFVSRPLTAESTQVANVLIEFLWKEKNLSDLFIEERILIRKRSFVKKF